MSNPYLGVIEGFYGDPWTWEVRCGYPEFLSRAGFRFFIYAPKADKYLRKNWAQPWPASELGLLKSLSQLCKKSEIDFGIGLSPFEIYKNYDSNAKSSLLNKVRLISSELAPEILCLLFDDMQGDLPGLAELQVQIANDVASVSTAKRIILCPTYYSTDPILEKLFGKIDENYLRDLGQKLDKRFDIFWTGPRICSTEYPKDHLEWISDKFCRHPFLWDNYPVNDDAKMSKFLHLRAFDNRPPELQQRTRGHASNPMVQPWLSKIPLATLPMSYQPATLYSAKSALEKSLIDNCGVELGSQILKDLELFQDIGLENLTETQSQYLAATYSKFTNNEYAKELIRWASGQYKFDPNCFTE